MPAVRSLSRRATLQLRTLEAAVRALSSDRSKAFQLLRASREATTRLAQRDFWLEFVWLDQEYRIAVHRLATFCRQYQRAADPYETIGEEGAT